jgi:hypothetical protein
MRVDRSAITNRTAKLYNSDGKLVREIDLDLADDVPYPDAIVYEGNCYQKGLSRNGYTECFLYNFPTPVKPHQHASRFEERICEAEQEAANDEYNHSLDDPNEKLLAPDTIDSLCNEYREWNAAQGLHLGSADEHLEDESLTQEQRDWLADFSDRWQAAALADSEVLADCLRMPEGA